MDLMLSFVCASKYIDMHLCAHHNSSITFINILSHPNGWWLNQLQADKCLKLFDTIVLIIHSSIDPLEIVHTNNEQMLQHSPSAYICQWIYNGILLSSTFVLPFIWLYGWVWVRDVYVYLRSGFIPHNECDRKPNAAINFRFTFIHSNSLFETMASDSIRHAFVANSMYIYIYIYFRSFILFHLDKQLHLPVAFVCLLLHLIGKSICVCV